MKKILKFLKNKQLLKNATAVLIFFVILLFGLYYLKTKDRILIENSVVSTPITVLSPTVPGKIKSIEVNDGQKVNKGDRLAVVGSEVLRAYTNGVIIDVNKQIGSIATTQTPVVKMVNLAEMRIDGTIDENKGLNKIKIGQVASFTIDALPEKTFWGYIDEIAESAKQTQISFSISSERPTQQFDVFARFDASLYPQIKNGMSTKMTVYTSMP